MGDSSEAESFKFVLIEGRSPRLVLETLDRPLRPERTDAVSAALSPLDSPLERSAEFLGLSVLPGILERRERKDREESLVSERLKDGMDWKPASPEPAEPLPSLEGWLPMRTEDSIQRDVALSFFGFRGYSWSAQRPAPEIARRRTLV